MGVFKSVNKWRKDRKSEKLIKNINKDRNEEMWTDRVNKEYIENCEMCGKSTDKVKREHNKIHICNECSEKQYR